MFVKFKAITTARQGLPLVAGELSERTSEPSHGKISCLGLYITMQPHE